MLTDPAELARWFAPFVDLNGAVLLVEMEPGSPGPVQTGLWLSTWAVGPERLDAVRAGLQAVPDAVFGPAPGEWPGSPPGSPPTVKAARRTPRDPHRFQQSRPPPSRGPRVQHF